MDITITEAPAPLPTRYAHSISMVIKSFKGRRDVEVHLFRPTWDSKAEADENWCKLVASCNDHDDSRSIVMESFSSEERDRIINYLKEQYSTRLTAIHSTPLTFPVPTGLSGLSSVQTGKNVGIIEFEKIPSYSLGIPLRGLYDLSQHPPMADE